MDSQDDSTIGKLIAGRYAVVRKLNQGGMGAVYLAMQRPLDRPVAVKVLLRHQADDPTSARRFEKEARAVSRLTHPHVVTLYDFGRTEQGELYIAMEYLQGASLRELLQSSGALPWDRALHVVRGVTSALVAAHGASIVHRDLKPENVMLVERSGDPDFVKVLDFGLARSADDTTTSITQRDVIPGTPAYLAPERANGISDDPRSDLYALGAVWFELLTGHAPFEGESSIKIILRHIHDPVPIPSRVSPDAGIPPSVDALVAQLLEKAPERRPATAADLLERLDALHRPSGWHVSGVPSLAVHAEQDEGLRGFADAAAALEELDFALEDNAGGEEPVLLTRRKSLPPTPGLQLSGMIGVGGMPAPDLPPSRDEPLLLVHKKTEGPPSAPAAMDTSPAALHLLEKKKPPQSDTPAAARVHIASVAEVSAHLHAARTTRDVGELCVAFLGTRFDRAFVLDLRSGLPQLLAATGVSDVGGIPGAVLRSPGLQELLMRRDAYYGAAPTGPDWLGYFRTLGGSLPGAIFVGALKREGRAAFFFYGDHRDLLLRAEVKDTVVLMREAAAAFSAVPV